MFFILTRKFFLYLQESFFSICRKFFFCICRKIYLYINLDARALIINFLTKKLISDKIFLGFVLMAVFHG